MDIATIIGVISGFVLIFSSLAMGSTGILGFVDVPSVLVVIGGTIAAILIMFPLKTVLGTFKVSMNVFTVKLKSPEEVIKMIVGMAKKARKAGILALEKEKFNDKFMAKGIQLCVDGTPPKEITKILATELSQLRERHKSGQDVFEQMGAMAPAFGMIGTLIGLVQMLQNLSDPAAIGPAMAVALLTTFYGAVAANLICIPAVAKKLELRSREESLIKELMIEGITAIAKQQNPIAIGDRLEVYLAPRQRKG